MIERVNLSEYKPLEQALRLGALTNFGVHKLFFVEKNIVQFKQISESIFDIDYSSVNFINFEKMNEKYGSKLTHILRKHEFAQREKAIRALLDFECAMANLSLNGEVLENMIKQTSSYWATPVNAVLRERKAIEIIAMDLAKHKQSKICGSELLCMSCCTSNGRSFWDIVYLELVRLAQQKVDTGKMNTDYFAKNAGYLIRYHLEPCQYEDKSFIETRINNLIEQNPCIDLKEEREKIRIKSAGLIAQRDKAIKSVKGISRIVNILNYNIFRMDYEDTNHMIRAKTLRNLSEMSDLIGLNDKTSYLNVIKKLC